MVVEIAVASFVLGAAVAVWVYFAVSGLHRLREERESRRVDEMIAGWWTEAGHGGGGV